MYKIHGQKFLENILIEAPLLHLDVLYKTYIYAKRRYENILTFCIFIYTYE